MFIVVNLMGYQNTTFFMMTDVLTREKDLGEINSLKVKLQYFSGLVCYPRVQNDLIFFCLYIYDLNFPIRMYCSYN